MAYPCSSHLQPIGSNKMGASDDEIVRTLERTEQSLRRSRRTGLSAGSSSDDSPRDVATSFAGPQRLPPPPPPPPFRRDGTKRPPAPKVRRSVSFAVDDAALRRERKRAHRSLAHEYALGDAPRHPSHLLVSPTRDLALQSVDALQTHDFAFVRRSDGRYTFAILAHRSFAPDKGSSELEERMLFVMDEEGSTKTIRRRHWADVVRPLLSSCEHKKASASSSPSVPERSPAEAELNKPFRDFQEPICREIAPAPPAQFCREVHRPEVPSQDVERPQEEEDRFLDWSGLTISCNRVEDDEVLSMISSVSDRARMGSRASSH